MTEKIKVNFLSEAAEKARERVRGGYYEFEDCGLGKRLLAKAVNERFGVIAELKHRSPTEPVLFQGDSVKAAQLLEKAGACAISLITEPRFFGGSLNEVSLVKKATGIPVLMKDFVVCREQIEAAGNCGADALLLISELFEKGLAQITVNDAVLLSHKLGLEVLLEVHSFEGFKQALETDADLIGINNRDLATMKVDIATTASILGKMKADKPVVSMSGIKTREDVAAMKGAGASAVLVGTAFHKGGVNPVKKLRELMVIE